jgi:glycosyltransferase involved in cell wall biosynthesis
MRVLTVVFSLGPGGMERVAQNYTLGYQQLGHDVALLAYSGGGPREEPLREANVPLFVGGISDAERLAATNEAGRWQPEVIHIHRPGMANAMTAALLRQLKAAAHGRTVVLETNVFARPDYSADRQLIDVHLLLTRWCLWKWRRWSRGLRPTPVGTVIPNMIDMEAFCPSSDTEAHAFRNEFGIPQDAFLFGRVGQPIEAKWSPVALEAFSRMASDSPRAYLLLVGLPPGYEKYIAAMPSNVRRRVIQISFLHGDQRLRACYTAMDVLLHAARIGESFGLVLVEAVRCGCPAITLSTPAKDNSQIEVVGHERGGLVVGDLAQMVRAMNRLMEDDALRGRLAEQGSQWARENYAIDAAMPRLVRVAALALAAENRDSLRDMLDKDRELVTDVSESEIKRLRTNLWGRPPLADRLLARLVHVPWIFRQWSRVREFRERS